MMDVREQGRLFVCATIHVQIAEDTIKQSIAESQHGQSLYKQIPRAPKGPVDRSPPLPNLFLLTNSMVYTSLYRLLGWSGPFP